MNRDDDSILSDLLHRLDLDSALFHLQRIGFNIVSIPCNTQAHHHLRRYKEEEEYEEILIQVNADKHFRIKHAYKGQMVAHPDTINTWDEWVAFVSPMMVNKGPKKMREDSCCKEAQEEEKATKRLKCAEQ